MFGKSELLELRVTDSAFNTTSSSARYKARYEVSHPFLMNSSGATVGTFVFLRFLFRNMFS